MTYTARYPLLEGQAEFSALDLLFAELIRRRAEFQRARADAMSGSGNSDKRDWSAHLTIRMTNHHGVTCKVDEATRPIPPIRKTSEYPLHHVAREEANRGLLIVSSDPQRSGGRCAAIYITQAPNPHWPNLTWVAGVNVGVTFHFLGYWMVEGYAERPDRERTTTSRMIKEMDLQVALEIARTMAVELECWVGR